MMMGGKRLTPIDPKVKADALAELLPGFIRRRKEDILVLHEAAGANDFARVAEVAHKIRGNGATFGFPELSEIAERLELAAKKGEEPLMRREIEQLEKRVGELDAKIAPPAGS